MIFTGFFNACMDVSRYRWDTSIFRFFKNKQWFNPSLSQKNKWKNGDIKQGEKFFGTSTFLVWLTDFWHFSKMLMILFICLTIVFYIPIFNWYIDLIIFYLLFTVTFELCFSKFLIKK